MSNIKSLEFLPLAPHFIQPDSKQNTKTPHFCPLLSLSSSHKGPAHYWDVTMGAMASQITSLTCVYSTVYSGAAKRKHQSSASLAFVRGIHRWLVNSPHKWPVTRKMFQFDDVIMDKEKEAHVMTSWCSLPTQTICFDVSNYLFWRI